MGCCKSSPEIDTLHLHPSNSIRASSIFTNAESTQLETLLSEIPEHCRKSIMILPVRQLLNFYQYHLIASYHALQREWYLAISYEQSAIQGLEALLPLDRYHYIFFNPYSVLSASFFALGELQAAIEGIHLCLNILLTHTSKDYKTISNHYYYLADAYKARHNWKLMEKYLTKAITTERLSSDIDQEYIRMLEKELQLAKQKIIADKKFNAANDENEPRHSKEDPDFFRRLTARLVIQNAEHATLKFDRAEFNRSPDKHLESQVTNEILQDVLKHLENYIYSDWICGSGQAPYLFAFIAAQFKNIQMPTSPLSVAIIEAALSMIIDRINDRNSANDNQYIALKQAPVSISYINDSKFYAKGMRVFQVEQKKNLH